MPASAVYLRCVIAALVGVFATTASAHADDASSRNEAAGAAEADAEAAHVAVQRLPLAQLDAALPADATLRLFTIADQPGLYILHAPSLAVQGAMFSRVVALTERRDMPRDRIVSMAAVATNARRFGEDPAGLTAGNNFSVAQIATFFDVARTQHVTLTRGERELRAVLVRWGLLRDDAGGRWRAASTRDFLVTIPGLGIGPAGERIDATVRAAILSHELGHWRYFSDAAYARACRAFWWQRLSYTQRAALTQQLADMGYDPSDRIVIDELQAYLLHTPARFMPIVDTPGAGGVNVAAVRRGLEESVRLVNQPDQPDQ